MSVQAIVLYAGIAAFALASALAVLAAHTFFSHDVRGALRYLSGGKKRSLPSNRAESVRKGGNRLWAGPTRYQLAAMRKRPPWMPGANDARVSDGGGPRIRHEDGKPTAPKGPSFDSCDPSCVTRRIVEVAACDAVTLAGEGETDEKTYVR